MTDREHVPSAIALGIALNWYAWRLQRRGLPRGQIEIRVMGAACGEIAISAGHWDGTYGTWGYRPEHRR